MTTSLFDTLHIGTLAMPNRIVMAPMTRSRADAAGVVGSLTATYYAQRAGAGLMISEGIFPSPMGKGYIRTPGVHSRAQIAAWRKVTDAVHLRGGRIFAQLMHAGRISDPSFLPDGAVPVAPSAVRPVGSSYTDAGALPFRMPRALTMSEVEETIKDFARATRNALEAGFDGVQLHAGTGYLPMQFLSESTNLRADRYGHGLRGRMRFVLETIDAMIAVATASRVAIRLTPEMTMNDMHEPDPARTYAVLARELAGRGLGFVDVTSPNGGLNYHAMLRPLLRDTPYFAGGGLTPARAAALLASGAADAVLFGQLFISNPDLPARLRLGEALQVADGSTFYSGGASGYIDYPSLEDLQGVAA